MRVEREQIGSGLHGVGRDPRVVRRDRAPVPAELRGDAPEAVSGIEGDREQRHARMCQEGLQLPVVVFETRAAPEPEEQLACDDGREQDPLGAANGGEGSLGSPRLNAV